MQVDFDSYTDEELDEMKIQIVIEMAKGGSLKELGDLAGKLGEINEVLWWREDHPEESRGKL